MLFFGVYTNIKLLVAMLLATICVIMMIYAMLPKDLDLTHNFNLLDNLERNCQTILSAITVILASFAGLTALFYNLML